MTPPHAWRDLYPAGATSPVRTDLLTMLDAWRASVSTYAEQPAVLAFDRILSFADVDAASDALAAAFQDKGVTPGDRVAIYLQNDPQWLVCLLAAWKCGASIACINPMLRQRELLHHLKDAAPTVLVCLDSLYAEIVSGVRDQINVSTVITTAPWDMLGAAPAPAAFRDAWSQRQTFLATSDWLILMSEFHGKTPSPASLTAGDVAMLTYTSGTTGSAKGAMILHSGMLHSSHVFATWFDIQAEHDVILGAAPLFHITGSVAGLGVSILTGAPVVLLHRFDPAATLEAIETHRASFTVMASTAYNALSNHSDTPNRNLSSLTKAASGGAPLSVGLVAQVRDKTGWILHGVYGLTETTSPSTMCPPGVEIPIDPESGALSVGVPVPGAEVSIADVDTGAPLPLGSVGEITVAGPMVIPGYWNAPEESAHAIKDGTLHTGDVGLIGPTGWLFVIDRKKDLINAGGYKIWPRDVEDVLHLHPSVQEAAVIGVPHQYRGETVKAIVSLRAGSTASPEEIIEFCKSNIAAYKYPRIVEIVDELPKNASGKILRRQLRDAPGTRPA